ncbi:MAG: RsmD family RNA methyltransferase, partial [Bacilli bacterium]
IGPYFPEWSVLDLFGGSGALSLESISRGARHAVIVEKEKSAYDIIMKNVNMLKAETDTNIMLTDYKIALSRLTGVKFDLIFLDPPYKMNIIEDIIEKLKQRQMLKANALIVCHYVKGSVKILENEQLIKNFSYGGGECAIYRIGE